MTDELPTPVPESLPSTRQNGQCILDKIAKRARAIEALDLRLTGMTYHDIAQELGYADDSTCYRSIMRELDRQAMEASEQVKKMELRRLDKMLHVHWAKAMDGDTGSADLVLKIMERRSKYMGLDEPFKVAQTNASNRDWTPERMVKLIERLISTNRWEGLPTEIRARLVKQAGPNAVRVLPQLALPAPNGNGHGQPDSVP